MVEMKVFGLALDEDSQVPVLILKDIEEKRVLPIWIGAMEAMAISLVLNGVTLPRPMTHDLLLNTITDLGFTVDAIEVVGLDDGTYYAEIVAVSTHMDQPVTKRIDCRPSDAVAVALRADCPIRVARPVLDEAGIDDEKASAMPDATDSDKWTEILEKFDPDTNTKM